MTAVDARSKNPTVGDSIPLLATIQVKAAAKNDADTKCPIL
jgi:hypothetical protein